ncbi:hydroxymethylbilane synthase [Bryobacter aggregatus]|uniref:hydroxymethylbilane synthase n=1 Tax=Bryobacter aggregatus TaxID=360054 RepID=UPI0004E16418|nr:hydroxymethylbilane synthase [Bryobacter aggregatus]
MITIGSRGSMLALWQARHVQSLLKAHGHESKIEVIQTTGDKITDVPLAKLGAETSTKGLFTKELEDALLQNRIDLAVHSLKDMPTVLPPGLEIVAVPEREDPFDAIVGMLFDELPYGAVLGTSSLRRQSQLKALRPDLNIQSIRGNLDTRLRKLDEGQYQAIVLACAGLKRLGWSSRIAERLDASRLCPAVGQGALAIEARAGDRLTSILTHVPTFTAVSAERACLREFGGGCQIPLGAYASWRGEQLHLEAVVASPDGQVLIRHAESGMEPESLGRSVAAALIERGAREVLG